MHSELTKQYSNILECVRDIEYHYKELYHDDLTIEDLHVVRDDDGKPTSLRVVTLYNRQH